MDIQLFDRRIREACPDGPMLDLRVREQLVRHVRAAVDMRSEVNLLGTDSLEEAVARHTADSLQPSFLGLLSGDGTWADVGTGGGFPGLVLALAVPTIRMVLVESRGRKRDALETILLRLSRFDSALEERVRLEARRAEELGREEGVRDQLEGVVCRALAPLPVALELCLPLVRPGGRGVFFKGARFEEECSQASSALRELGGRIESLHPYRLATDGIERALVVVSKEGVTPRRYPRRVGVPGRRPLGS